jgi:tetratricopeptide (TPR) repeat protein
MAEKSLNDLPRDLRALFTKGNDALQRENFDYAIELFTHVLEKEPTVFEARKALRIAQQKKSGGGGGFFKKVLSSAGSSPLVAKAQLALRKDPREALPIIEQILNSDSANGPAHRMFVEAATTLEMPRSAVLSLEILARNSPKDRDLAIQFARSLADAGEVSRGERILADLSRSYPGDIELAQALKDLSARKTLSEGGYQAVAAGTGSYRDILKDKAEAVSLEQEKRHIKTEDTAQRLINEYEARLQNDPKNVKLLRDLAELYTQKKDFDKALGFYDRIKATDVGSDASLDRGIAETTTRKFDHQIAQLDPNALDHADQVARIQAEKQAFQLTECQRRAERFPTDLQIRYELGQLYFHAGKMGEAIQEFQKAKRNPQRLASSLNFLGQCYARRNMNELAVRTFEEALKEKPVFDEEKKELVYNLAGVLEKAGKREDAIKQLEIIYAEDIGYRDVQAKVDGFYSGQQGAAE